jgi:hypothetical protein
MLAGMACVGAPVGGAEEKEAIPPKLPAMDFARLPDVSAAQLSPDGKYLAYVYGHEIREEVAFLDIEKNRARYYNPGIGSVVDFVWASGERAIVLGWGGLGSIKRNTEGWQPLTGAYRYFGKKGATDLLYADEILYVNGRDPEHVLIVDRNDGAGTQWIYPDVIEMDATNGVYRVRLKNPGDIIQWQTDWDGRIRFGLKWKDRTARLIVRDDENSTWRGTRRGRHCRRGEAVARHGPERAKFAHRPTQRSRFLGHLQRRSDDRQGRRGDFRARTL